MKTEVGRNWYQLIHYDELYELSGRQVSFSGPQWTPSRGEHKRVKRLLYILTLSQPVYAPLVMVSIEPGKGHLPAIQFIITNRLIPVSTPLRFH
jgi:hypothetical protein